MAAHWMDNTWGDLFLVGGGLVITLSHTDPVWKAITAVFTAAWVVIAVHRVVQARRKREDGTVLSE
ncbi:hypothetical protein QNO07_04775 [Streptomyces sp. 549]|uniref:hypothetical protein n=1 Tax=Streptomyces sp. 549 TaxID=3049076 RepID=UPI0024C31DA2|nr:hypothetical protein [Streptomyces sp. 549]MDK1472747.1 hypothetical protein [Streptomyces sp. 549]